MATAAAPPYPKGIPPYSPGLPSPWLSWVIASQFLPTLKAVASMAGVAEPSLRQLAFMPEIESGELIWFVHPMHGVKNALAFIRDHKSGAYIYGGHTGSHYTGHGESWTQKLELIESLGYLSLSNARSQGVVPVDWQPPEDDARQDVIVRGIQRGEL